MGSVCVRRYKRHPVILFVSVLRELGVLSRAMQVSALTTLVCVTTMAIGNCVAGVSSVRDPADILLDAQMQAGQMEARDVDTLFSQHCAASRAVV